MWKKIFSHKRPADSADFSVDDYKALFSYINHLAYHKLGYPVSLLTYLGVVNNEILGIKPDSLANILLNNVGDPFKDSETSLMEVKKHEREVIGILEKFYGIEKGEARGYVTTGGTEGNFASLWWSKRYLINMALDELITADNAIKLQIKEERELNAALGRISINDPNKRAAMLQNILDLKNAIDANKNTIQELLTPTVFYTKGHTHYSVPKVAEILRLNIRPVEPAVDGSMDINALKKELILNLGAHPKSAIIVIANIGTTITGAVDEVPAIKNALDSLQTKPYHTIHLDGALIGFVMPILKPFGDIPNYFAALGVNTLAVSAHKYPGLSQPCGIILARKNFFDKAFEKGERSIDYVGNISDVTITGSRSGLNVLMFYNALRTLGLDKGTKKLQAMVNDNIKIAKYLYGKLKEMYGEENVQHPYHFNVMFPRPSQALAKKYQLMLTGDRATICVLTNVTKELVDLFIEDLKSEQEKKAMTSTTTKVEYTVHTLKEEHMKAALDLFVKSFCDSEPVTKHLGINYKDYEPFARDVLQKAIKEGMSKVALDKQNHVIACAIAEDMADPFVPHLAHYPKLKPVIGLLDQLSKPFLSGRKFTKGKVVHVWIAAVDSTYRGKGLSTIIDMAAVEAAARKGFDFAYAEFTNELSENVTHQFKVIKPFNKLAYNDYIFEDGSKPFKGLHGASVSYLAAIRPGVKLEGLEHCYVAK